MSMLPLEHDTEAPPQAPVTPDLSILIVNWKSAEFTLKCVDSIRKQRTELTYEILVIDNASFDGCDKLLREHAPEVRFVQGEKNLGFAKANNQAFRSSIGSTILFLNPDTEIVGPAIDLLYRALHQEPAAGAVGAQLLNGDGSIQTSCIQSFPTILNQALNSDYLRKKWPDSVLWGTQPLWHDHGRPEEVEAICGACLMIKRAFFQQIGRFNEDYFMYAEDIDLCYKVRQAGSKAYYIPGAKVIHFGGSSSKKAPSNFSSVMMRQSIWRFLRNTRGDLYGLGYRLAMSISAVCRLLLLSASELSRSFRHRGHLSDPSFRKWWAILRWSLGRDGSNPSER